MVTRRFPTLLVALSGALLLAGLLSLLVEPEETSHSGPARLTVAPGFELELVAGPPLVERPMIIDADEQGRLYVAESSGSSAPVKEQLAERPHSILRLEDTDGDGRFDKRTVFADKMMFPEGVLWYDGSLYVSAPPSIWKLTDKDGDGVAEQRQEWYNGQTLTGCANDLHGPYLGHDGWIYWCKGAFAEQTIQRPGRKPLVTRASHIFRRRPEGGFVEPVLTGGMDNPVEVAFSPEGERFLTATFVEHPQFGRRDGLIHAIYGGVYGKVHGVTDGHPQTGGFLSPMINLGPAVPVGLTFYDAPSFGDEYKGNLFATLFNLHKVVRFQLTPKGATFEPAESDFFVSESQDFHPTDVMQDADGSLLVVDTGGWYKLCCPTSQLAKPDVLGAIYRIRRKGAAPVEDPRGIGLDWTGLPPDYLTTLLGDPRPAVRKRAIHELSKKGLAALPALQEALKDSTSTERRRNAVWALTRITDAQARAAVRDSLADPDESVRHAAMHSISVWRDAKAAALLEGQLTSRSPALQRVAAEALGRIGDRSAIAPLLATVANAEEETLAHSLTYALIEIADPAETRKGLDAPSPRTRRAAMIALDQMEAGGLPPDNVVPLLSSADPLLRDTAGWIAGHHPEWGGALSGFFGRGLADPALDADARAALEHQVVQFASHPAIQALLAQTARSAESKPARLSAMRVMAKVPLKETPAGWDAALIAAMNTADAELLRGAVAAARVLPVPEKGNPVLDAALARLGRDTAAPDDVRADALAVAAPSLQQVEPELFAFLLAQLDAARPAPVRGAASRALAKAPLNAGQLLTLTDSLSNAGPLELPTLLGAYDKGGDEKLGETLLAALGKARGLANLRADLLETALKQFPPTIQQKGAAVLVSLDVDRSQQQAHLEQVLATLQPGDVRRGQAVFNSTKMACSSCHKIGYLGGRVGPDLTRVGDIRNERDLLEAVLYPSASFVRSYEPVVVVTSGDVYNGVPVEETEDYVLLATGVNTEARINRASIQEMRPGTVSVMPSGLEQELSKQDLSDLISFLLATRRGP
jgi:putative membrane-bound dehydrogenase-like protein